MSAGRAFFDTNVFLHVYSSADPRKQARALSLYREYAPVNGMLLSTQVVQEFIAASRKLGLTFDLVREIAQTMLDSPLVVIAPSHIQSAMNKAERYGISFWDALILAAAEAGGAEIVYSEDLSHGQDYGGVRVENPFR